MATKTNNLTYSTSKIVNGKNFNIKIRLNDKCNNGHEDFAITADVYEADKPKIDKYFIMGGCCHKEILKYFPKFKIFVDLHLSKYNGIPSSSIDNGFFHIHTEKWEKSKFAEYYRLPNDIVDKLYNAKEKELFAYIIYTECLSIWKKQGDEAIKLLESLTEKEFEQKAISRYDEFAKYDFKDIKKKIKKGYYSDENMNNRITQKIIEANAKLLNEYKEERAKKLNAINMEYDCLEWLCNYGISLNNFIFHSHSKEACFNWKSFEPKLTIEQFEKLKQDWIFSEIKLVAKEF